MPAEIEERRFEGEPGLTLRAGGHEATFLPHVGMTGVSWTRDGNELLALPGGVAALRRAGTNGIPLLAPWANRLSTGRFRTAGVEVDLDGAPVPTDEHGLPVHGLLLGGPRWSVDHRTTSGDVASLTASIEVDEKRFPLPHRLIVRVDVDPDQLHVSTTLVPTGDRAVPAAFGWHPYLRPGATPRHTWILRLPERTHLELDDRGIPTGDEQREVPEAEPIGHRTFDDLYALGSTKRLALETEETAIELWCGEGYDFAQVWVPAHRTFAALEPMVARTNALVDGTAPLVPPKGDFTARFALLSRTA